MKISWRDIELDELIHLAETQPEGESRSMLKLTVSYFYRRCKEQRVKAMTVDGEVVCVSMYGFVSSRNRSYVNLLTIAVLHEHRRKGYGSAALTIIHTEASDKGLANFKLEASNLKSKAWYIKKGFCFPDEKSRKCFMETSKLDLPWPFK